MEMHFLLDHGPWLITGCVSYVSSNLRQVLPRQLSLLIYFGIQRRLSLSMGFQKSYSPTKLRGRP